MGHNPPPRTKPYPPRPPACDEPPAMSLDIDGYITRTHPGGKPRRPPPPEPPLQPTRGPRRLEHYPLAVSGATVVGLFGSASVLAVLIAVYGGGWVWPWYAWQLYVAGYILAVVVPVAGWRALMRMADVDDAKARAHRGGGYRPSNCRPLGPPPNIPPSPAKLTRSALVGLGGMPCKTCSGSGKVTVQINTLDRFARCGNCKGAGRTPAPPPPPATPPPSTPDTIL